MPLLTSKQGHQVCVVARSTREKWRNDEENLQNTKLLTLCVLQLAGQGSLQKSTSSFRCVCVHTHTELKR